MIVNFIGQGLVPSDNESVGDYICSSLKDDLFDKCVFISAFASFSGLEKIRPFLEQAKEKNKTIVFYIGVDDKGTSKEALKFLIDNNFETYIFHTCSNFIFHPKLYIFQGKHNRIIIGSSNLTKYGLFHNIEAAMLLDSTNDDSAGKKVLNQINDSFQGILDNTDNNLNLLDNDLLSLLVSQRLVYSESDSKNDDNDFKKEDNDISDIFPERDKNVIIDEELGNKEVKENKQYNRENYDIIITAGYLAKWDSMFARLIQYKEQYNSVVVKNDFHDKSLYGWYTKQKKLYSHNLLPTEHKEKLDSIGFYWDDAHKLYWDSIWETRFNELLQLKNEPNWPNLKRYKDNTQALFSISNWIAEQRGKYKKKELNENQIQRLESIGFIWDMKKIFLDGIKDDDGWFDSLTELQEYKDLHGDCNVSQTDSKYKQLGKWLNDQRTNKKRNKLDKSRIDLLDEIGVVWDMDVYNFELIINELKAYKLKYGDYNVPVNYKGNLTLGNYVYRVKTNGLKEEWKIKRLTEIGFDLIAVQAKSIMKGRVTKDWIKTFDELESLAKTGVNPNLPKEYLPNQLLATWVYNQKKSYRHDRLKPQQIEDLKRIGVELIKENTVEKSWEEMFTYLQLYYEEYGNTKVSSRFDRKLASWTQKQRSNKRIGILPIDKQEKLNSINFDWNEKIKINVP